ncbi:coatomer subunit delta-like protein [Dinothrombium tinctorium]|uniref:Coatomer subunit delta n=1 Tax=Dinothrombium tinctorium TaxID=1965070 RepID=A0A3S3NV50_9ACAR|nr:coatomer subunit delta-like protein [Dinothrombium tinctorium]
MTRSRIEGLLTAFTKLITKDKQHTFIETDAVRYVYQALMDPTSDEQQILDNAFTLIFAFDEIVALGYRESVNMSQVRTFIEMDSHEERVYVAVRQTQEREAKQKMREKAKELSKLQRTQQLGNKNVGSTITSSLPVSSTTDFREPTVGDRAIGSSISSSLPPSRPRGTSKALKLGSKAGQGLFSQVNEEQLVTELRQEETPGTVTAPAAAESEEPVTVTVEEKLKCEVARDGGVARSCELSGIMQVLIKEEAYRRVKISVECEDESVQIQTHPSIDKELFKQQKLIGLRQKSFPLGVSVGVLKYRRVSTSGDDWPPLIINAWPNGNNCNLELQINKPLHDITINIPCPSQPMVNECSEGDYEWKRKTLTWKLSFLNMDSPNATIDFDLNETLQNDDFFPITCNFQSEGNLSGIKVLSVYNEDDEEGEEVKYASENKLIVEKYEIA